MPTTAALLEPSFLDLIAAIEQAAELSEQRRRHWTCSSRQIAKCLDRPAAAIPARWNSVQMSVGALHYARVGMTAKTLRTISPMSGQRCAGSPRSTICRSTGCAFRPSGPGSVTGSTSAYGSGSTTSYVTAQPAASDRHRSTTSSLMSIGTIASRRRHGHQTIPPAALWRGRGMPVWPHSKAGRCSGSPSRRSRSPSPPGRIPQRAA